MYFKQDSVQLRLILVSLVHHIFPNPTASGLYRMRQRCLVYLVQQPPVDRSYRMEAPGIIGVIKDPRSLPALNLQDTKLRPDTKTSSSSPNLRLGDKLEPSCSVFTLEWHWFLITRQLTRQQLPAVRMVSLRRVAYSPVQKWYESSRRLMNVVAQLCLLVGQPLGNGLISNSFLWRLCCY